jgi:hypothetical protein
MSKWNVELGVALHKGQWNIYTAVVEMNPPIFYEADKQELAKRAMDNIGLSWFDVEYYWMRHFELAIPPVPDTPPDVLMEMEGE